MSRAMHFNMLFPEHFFKFSLSCIIPFHQERHRKKKATIEAKHSMNIYKKCSDKWDCCWREERAFYTLTEQEKARPPQQQSSQTTRDVGRHENLPIFPTPTQSISTTLVTLLTVTAQSIMGLLRGKIFTHALKMTKMTRGRKTLINAPAVINHHNFFW
jgi:hypothetical protein